ncbi:MAG: hypothetical protein IT208_11855 [Chthonomonadales bacterium]|nr:hypothetical protein [Chthonomonadales bacterium]
MAAPTRGDLPARVVGALVFLAGVLVIFVVLVLAFRMFQDPNLGVRAGAASPTATDIGVGFLRLLLRIGLLFLGSVSGSLIANKGIRLYFAGLPGRAQPAEREG